MNPLSENNLFTNTWHFGGNEESRELILREFKSILVHELEFFDWADGVRERIAEIESEFKKLI